MDINTDQRRLILEKLRECLGTLKGKTIGLLGLAFKPNTDDMREAPSIEIARMLQAEGALVKAYDPVAMMNAGRILRDVALAEDPYELAEDCDAVIIVTEWNEFKQLDMGRMKRVMRQPVVIDGRNIYEPEAMKAHGFTYRGIGRGYNGRKVEPDNSSS
jgi:UDPglucose 6-dehydrogenase